MKNTKNKKQFVFIRIGTFGFANISIILSKSNLFVSSRSMMFVLLPMLILDNFWSIMIYLNFFRLRSSEATTSVVDFASSFKKLRGKVVPFKYPLNHPNLIVWLCHRAMIFTSTCKAKKVKVIILPHDLNSAG